MSSDEQARRSPGAVSAADEEHRGGVKEEKTQHLEGAQAASAGLDGARSSFAAAAAAGGGHAEGTVSWRVAMRLWAALNSGGEPFPAQLLETQRPAPPL